MAVGFCNSIEKVKLRWTDEMAEMVTDLMQISFHISKWFFAEAGTMISSNYSRLSVCKML